MVGHSLPILVSQALVVVALVYVEQGRAFLLLGNSVALLYLMAIGPITTVVFSRVLARRVDPDLDPAPDRPDRLRWLALQCGSVIAGLVSGFLPAGLIEKYVSGVCGVPRQMIDSYRGSAATVTMLVVAIGLNSYLIWRIKYRKSEGTTTRDVWLLLTVWLAAWAGNRVSSSYHLLVFGGVLVALTALLTLTVLTGPAPDRTRGGILEWRATTVAIVSLGAGVFLAIFPDSVSSGVALWIVLQFWTAAAVLLTVLLKRLWSDHLTWFFVALALLATGVIAFSGRLFQARDVRLLAGKPSARPLLDEYAKDWIQRRRLAMSGDSKTYPIILVAAAGGGIRAAYWTANLLAAFQDREPDFADHVFAISGVSGGSVGAAVFTALIKADCKPCLPHARTILAQDFLAPALAGLLTRDVVSTVFHDVNLPDRGVALEQKFEQAWQDDMHTRTFEEPFDDLWDERHKAPTLFLNATEAGSAQRAVFSNVSLAGIPSAAGSTQEVAEKLRLRLSTAMLLSARFPYISPEGQVGPANGSMRFVDGGYFDNSGAATLLDVVRSLRIAVRDLGASKRFRLVTLVIRNEPIPIPGCSPKPEHGGFGTPLAILDKLRSQRAEQFTSQLHTLIEEQKDDRFLDSFRPESGGAEFPLGWTLPEATVKEMDGQIAKRMKDGVRPIADLPPSLQH